MSQLNDSNPLTADGDYEIQVIPGTPYEIYISGNVECILILSFKNPQTGLWIEIKQIFQGGPIVFQVPSDHVRITASASTATNSTYITCMPCKKPGGLILYDANDPVIENVQILDGSQIYASGYINIAGEGFSRPTDTTTYASGDLVANSTTAGAVTFGTISTGYYRNSMMLRRFILRKSGTSLVNAQFRIHLFRSAPITAGGDNATLSLTSTSNYIGAVDITMNQAFSDYAFGFGTPNDGNEISMTGTGIRFVIEARASYAPVSGESFTLLAETYPS